MKKGDKFIDINSNTKKVFTVTIVDAEGVYDEFDWYRLNKNCELYMPKYNNDKPIIIKQHIFSDDNPSRLELMKEVEEVYYISAIEKDGTISDADWGNFDNKKDATITYYDILNNIDEYEIN